MDQQTSDVLRALMISAIPALTALGGTWLGHSLATQRENRRERIAKKQVLYERLLLALSDAEEALGVLARFEQQLWPEDEEAEKARRAAERHWSERFSAAVDELRRSTAVAMVIVPSYAAQALEQLLVILERAREARMRFEFIDESAAAVSKARAFLTRTARIELDL